MGADVHWHKSFQFSAGGSSPRSESNYPRGSVFDLIDFPAGSRYGFKRILISALGMPGCGRRSIYVYVCISFV